MSFQIKQETKHQVIAQERLYLTADKTRVVSEGDKDAAHLLAAVGQPVPIHLAKQFGLVVEEPKAEAPAATRSNRRAQPDTVR